MREINILVGCEESGIVTKAFRDLGFNAFSCDLKPTSGNHPEWHLQMDVFEAVKLKKWDMGIFFPTCTYLTLTANRWIKDQPERLSGALVGQARRDARVEASKFFMDLYNCDIPRIAIENPIGVMSTLFRKPDQVIQPWMFGHREVKGTCLWVRGLPKLTPTNIVQGREAKMHMMGPSKDRTMLRSKTYPGIAKALAKQYTDYILNN